MIIIKDGNLVDATENVIAHQVNCRGLFNAGVAYSIRRRFPIVYKSYKVHVDRTRDGLLGTNQYVNFSYVNKEGVEKHYEVCNMFAQDELGYHRQFTSYLAFDECVSQLYEYASSNNLSVAMPYGIACGRGGANWDKILRILGKYFTRDKITNLVLYRKEE